MATYENTTAYLASLRTQLSGGFGPGDTGWFVMAWSKTVGGTNTFKCSSLGGTWGDKAGTTYSEALHGGHENGFRTGYSASAGGQVAPREFAYVTLFSDEHTMGDLETIYDELQEVAT